MKPTHENIQGKATICIPNYKTLEFTRICLRSIRKFTNYPYEVVVIDNDSQDESLEYLRSLSWIRLIENRSPNGKLRGSDAEGTAFDIGLANCNTEFYVAMHSDTFVHKANWLTNLIRYFDDDRKIACVGTDKIELKPKWQVLLKKATDVRTFKRKLLREPDPHGRFRHHNRTVCCLYRTAVLKEENLSFRPDKKRQLTAGKALYVDMVDRGCATIELPSSVLSQYVLHLNHATQATNILEFSLRKRTIRKCNRNIRKIMSSETTRSILTDDSLDR